VQVLFSLMLTDPKDLGHQRIEVPDHSLEQLLGQGAKSLTFTVTSPGGLPANAYAKVYHHDAFCAVERACLAALATAGWRRLVASLHCCSRPESLFCVQTPGETCC
jgi:hypothetical protein